MYLEITGVNKIYQTGQVSYHALKDAEVKLEAAEIGVLLGPSGSGKSTLMNVIGGVDRVNSGTIQVDGKAIHNMNDKQLTEYRRQDIGFVFQFYNLIPNLTVYENVELTANISQNPMEIKQVLEAVGLSEMMRRFPHELSGGQQQRTSLARALVKNPKLLLCDEPTGALDYETSKEILKLLDRINREYNTTILIITHNEAIGEMADRVFRMRSGEIVENRTNLERTAPERIEW